MQCSIISIKKKKNLHKVTLMHMHQLPMDLCPIKNNMSKNLQPHHPHLSSEYISMNLCSSKIVELNIDINNNHD